MQKFGSFKRFFFGFILNYYEQVAISNVLEQSHFLQKQSPFKYIVPHKICKIKNVSQSVILMLFSAFICNNEIRKSVLL